MYRNTATQAIVQDYEPVIGPDGTNYPGAWDKTTLPFLHPVTLTPGPTDPTVTVTGYVIVNDTQIWETTPITLAQAQATATAALSGLATAALAAPVMIAALGFATCFAPQWAGLITGAKDAVTANPSLAIQWEDVNGSFHVLGATQVLDIWTASLAYIQAVYSNQAALVADIFAQTEVAAVQALDMTQGWPATLM